MDIQRMPPQPDPIQEFTAAFESLQQLLNGLSTYYNTEHNSFGAVLKDTPEEEMKACYFWAQDKQSPHCTLSDYFRAYRAGVILPKIHNACLQWAASITDGAKRMVVEQYSEKILKIADELRRDIPFSPARTAADRAYEAMERGGAQEIMHGAPGDNLTRH